MLTQLFAQVLILAEEHPGANSTELTRRVFNIPSPNDYPSPMQRSKVLQSLAALERHGYIERGPTDQWLGNTVTLLGKLQVKLERAMPASERIRKPRRRALHAAAVAEGRTAYRKQVVSSEGKVRGVLKPGFNNMKLGFEVTKGHLRGYHIYSLTLEERKTCPKSCERWADCFGNNMGLATRYAHDKHLMPTIRAAVERLLRKHPEGVLIRLHVLGDFFSVKYVEFWKDLLVQHPKLAIFGYTAHDFESLTGRALRAGMYLLGFARFAIRFSSSVVRPCGATWYVPGTAPPEDTFACPEQTGRARSCASCAACWGGTKAVAFSLH